MKRQTQEPAFTATACALPQVEDDSRRSTRSEQDDPARLLGCERPPVRQKAQVGRLGEAGKAGLERDLSPG